MELKTTGCPGFCEQGPLVVIHPQKYFYTKVKPKDADDIITKTIVKDELVERLLYKDQKTGEKIVYKSEVPFYKQQTRVTATGQRTIEPREINDYIAVGGYKALQKALFEMAPTEVIEVVKQSSLRGRAAPVFQQGQMEVLPESARRNEIHCL